MVHLIYAFMVCSLSMSYVGAAVTSTHLPRHLSVTFSLSHPSPFLDYLTTLLALDLSFPFLFFLISLLY